MKCEFARFVQNHPNHVSRTDHVWLFLHTLIQNTHRWTHRWPWTLLQVSNETESAHTSKSLSAGCLESQRTVDKRTNERANKRAMVPIYSRWRDYSHSRDTQGHRQHVHKIVMCTWFAMKMGMQTTHSSSDQVNRERQRDCLLSSCLILSCLVEGKADRTRLEHTRPPARRPAQSSC